MSSPVSRGQIGDWGGRLTWVQSSAISGSNRLWTLVNGAEVVVTPEGLSLSSSLYGYGGITWCVIDSARVFTLHEREGVARVISVAGTIESSWPLPDGSVGCPVVQGDDVLFLLDGPPRGERRVCRLSLVTGQISTVYASSNFLSRLAVNGDRVAWTEWSPRTVPWEESSLVLARGTTVLNIESVRSSPGVSWGPPVAHGDAFATTCEDAEWANVVRDVDQREHRIDVSPGGAALSLVSWFGTSRLLASQGEVLAVVTAQNSARAVSVISDAGVVTLEGAMTSIEDVAMVASSVVVAGRRPEHSDRIELFHDRWQAVACGEEVSDRTLTASWRLGASAVPYVWWGADHPSTIVIDIHGGPTGEAGLRWSASISRWRATGFAVASVDYRGSTSYGRSYRRALNGGWGQLDVDDAASVISELATEFPSARIVVAGNSAGGLTALRVAALPGVWGAMVHYPVTDAATIIAMSHEFEAGYNDILFGTSDPSQLQDRRIAVEDLRRVFVTHGVEDSVVPIAGTRAFVRDARARGVDIAYIEIPGEGHGYRRAESLALVAAAEERFLLNQ